MLKVLKIFGVAYLPLPFCPVYATTKSALLHLGKSLRPVLARYNVAMNVICPGIVQTNMTARAHNDGVASSTMMSPDDAALRIAHGLDWNESEVVFPTVSALPSKLIGMLPVSLQEKVMVMLWKYIPFPGGELDSYDAI